MISGNQLFHAFDHRVDQQRMGEIQQVADFSGDNGLDAGFVHHFFQRGGEIGEDDDGFRAGIL